MKVPPEVMKQVEAAFRQYEAEVEQSELKLSAKHTYLLHSRQFVKWLKDEFQPGARKVASS